MIVTIWIKKLAYHILEYLRDEDWVFENVVEQATEIQIQIRTAEWLDLVSRFAEVPGVVSILVRPL